MTFPAVAGWDLSWHNQPFHLTPAYGGPSGWQRPAQVNGIPLARLGEGPGSTPGAISQTPSPRRSATPPGSRGPRSSRTGKASGASTRQGGGVPRRSPVGKAFQ